MYQRFAEGNKLDLETRLRCLRDAIISRYGLKKQERDNRPLVSLLRLLASAGISAQRAHHLNYTTLFTHWVYPFGQLLCRCLAAGVELLFDEGQGQRVWCRLLQLANAG